MADVPSSLRKVQIEEVSYRSALSESLFFKLGGVINWIIDNAGFKVADIQASMLDEASFQAQRTTDWVLMDGRSVVGSDYEAETGNSNIPDARGRTMRFKDNGRGLTNDLALGTERADQNLAHQHPGVPEHFGNVAAISRGAVGLPDTFNDITNNDDARVEHIGSTTGVPPASSLPNNFTRNPRNTGFCYSLQPAYGSSNVNKAWCTPMMEQLGAYDNTVGENANGFAFASLNEGGYGLTSSASLQVISKGTTVTGIKGSTIPANTLVGFNARLPSDGGNEVRVNEIHINYFIKINN